MGSLKHMNHVHTRMNTKAFCKSKLEWTGKQKRSQRGGVACPVSCHFLQCRKDLPGLAVTTE